MRCSYSTVVGKNDDGSNLYRSGFQAVYDSNPESENGKFFKWTPYGSIELGTTTQQFEPGKEYYLDFVPVEAAQ